MKRIINVIKANLPKPTIVVPIILYIALYILTSYAASSGQMLRLGNSVIPLSAAAGAFSALSQICLVLLVLYFKNAGFIAAIAVLVFPMLSLLRWVFVQGNFGSFTGLFTNIFTILMLVIIMFNHSRLEKEQKRMQTLFEQTAASLVNAIDAKDTYTHGHSSRVAEYSRRLAEMNYKSKKECYEIYYTALLHDVGKIGVPSSIINKAGKLTNEEYDIVKQHPTMGAQILDTISEYPYLSIGARYHHERYDGKGYPDGLKGEEIPEIARIISVADAYDAMTSKRSYRDPIPQDKVREQIVKGSGTQFDPVYARLMVHLIDDDTKYGMKERAKADESDINGILTVGSYREAVSAGIYISSSMITIRMMISSDDEAAGIAPIPSMILFDALDGNVHTDEKGINDCLYFEYGEIWFDGRTMTGGARKMQSKVENTGADDIKHNGEYKIEAVRIDDHALIRIASKEQTAEITVALPDSSRFMYIALTGEHCRISDLSSVKAEDRCSDGYIPRIADKISYIDAPAGDMPNLQIDGCRTAHSEGIPIKDGLKISFHTKSLPTARLVWHCAYIDVFSSDDGKVNGAGYRDIALIRLDGEYWGFEQDCTVNVQVNKSRDFNGWDDWKRKTWKALMLQSLSR